MANCLSFFNLKGGIVVSPDYRRMAACFLDIKTEEGRQVRQASMTIKKYLAKAERFRTLKERAGDPFNQHLFAQME
jgi:hypothetical protein